MSLVFISNKMSQEMSLNPRSATYCFCVLGQGTSVVQFSHLQTRIIIIPMSHGCFEYDNVCIIRVNTFASSRNKA